MEPLGGGVLLGEVIEDGLWGFIACSHFLFALPLSLTRLPVLSLSLSHPLPFSLPLCAHTRQSTIFLILPARQGFPTMMDCLPLEAHAKIKFFLPSGAFDRGI